MNKTKHWGASWRRCSKRWNPFAKRAVKATGWKVWNPGEYGEVWHAVHRRLYPPIDAPVMILGLNPGPYGMAQTGIPFTDVKRLNRSLPTLATALGAASKVDVPGLAPPSLQPFLTRTFESSSVRIYRFLEETFGCAEKATRAVVVANPCPLLFIDPETRRNITPADLGRVVRRRGTDSAAELQAEMDRLRWRNCEDALETLRPRAVVLLGKDVQKAVGEQLRETLGDRRVIDWEHPARAVPATWSAGLRAALAKNRVLPALSAIGQ